MNQMKKLLLKNSSLNLQIAGLIVKLKLDPDFIDINLMKMKLKEIFNQNYTDEEIKESLELLTDQQEELVVYPDQYINGI